MNRSTLTPYVSARYKVYVDTGATTLLVGNYSDPESAKRKYEKTKLTYGQYKYVERVETSRTVVAVSNVEKSKS